jgi:hypothetical protein
MLRNDCENGIRTKLLFDENSAKDRLAGRLHQTDSYGKLALEASAASNAENAA